MGFDRSARYPGAGDGRVLTRAAIAWAVAWPVGMLIVSLLPAWTDSRQDRFPGLLVSTRALVIYALALAPAVGAWLVAPGSPPGARWRPRVPPLPRPQGLLLAWTVSVLSWLAMAWAILVSLDNCTGTGQGYYRCEAFACQNTLQVVVIELFVISPGLLAAMLVTLRREGRRIRAMVWVTALCYLGVGRFAVLFSLTDVLVRTCRGL